MRAAAESADAAPPFGEEQRDTVRAAFRGGSDTAQESGGPQAPASEPASEEGSAMIGARQYGKLPRARWGEERWTNLSADAQWLYVYLVSQPTTDSAGVFPIRVSKWAKSARGMTKERVQAAAKELVDTGWIAVDHDSEEGLIRNYIRDDWAGDNIFKGAIGRALLCQSMRLRAILLSELHWLKNERPIIKDDQLTLIAELERTLPADFDLESVVESEVTSPGTTSTASTSPFEGRSNGDQTPFERRSEEDPDDADSYREFDRRNRP